MSSSNDLILPARGNSITAAMPSDFTADRFIIRKGTPIEARVESPALARWVFPVDKVPGFWAFQVNSSVGILWIRSDLLTDWAEIPEPLASKSDIPSDAINTPARTTAP